MEKEGSHMKQLRVLLLVSFLMAVLYQGLVQGSIGAPKWSIRVKKADPALYEIYSKGIAESSERMQTAPRRSRDFRDAMMAPRPPREAAEAAYIVEALIRTYEAESPDWDVVAVALFCANGVQDARVDTVAEEILRGIPDFRRDQFHVVEAAMYRFVRSGNDKQRQLVVDCIRPATLGIAPDVPLDSSQAYAPGARATGTFSNVIPLDEAKAALSTLVGRTVAALSAIPSLDEAKTELQALATQYPKTADLTGHTYRAMLGRAIASSLQGLEQLERNEEMNIHL